MALVLLVGLPLVLVPDLLIEGWIGDGFGDSTWVLALLGVVLLVHQPAHVMAQYLIARARQRDLAWTLVAVTLTNLGLTIGLAFAVGIWGVALATLVTEAVATAVLIPRLVVRASDISYVELVRASLRPLAPALVVAAAVRVGVARAYDPDTLAELVPLGVLWLAACAPLLWRLGFSDGERRSFVRELRKGAGAPVGAEPA
jgi:O-antigen/teichoic acid export membrane protein